MTAGWTVAGLSLSRVQRLVPRLSLALRRFLPRLQGGVRPNCRTNRHRGAVVRCRNHRRRPFRSGRCHPALAARRRRHRAGSAQSGRRQAIHGISDPRHAGRVHRSWRAMDQSAPTQSDGAGTKTRCLDIRDTGSCQFSEDRFLRWHDLPLYGGVPALLDPIRYK